MNENQSNPDVIQDEFTVCFEKKDGKYEVIAYTGSNKVDSRYLLKWAIVAAEMTNAIICDQFPDSVIERLKVLRNAVTKAHNAIAGL